MKNDFIFIYLFTINIMSFSFYVYDKQMSKKGKQRIKEFTLLLLSFLGGVYGSVFAMNTFKHKTKKLKFIIVNYLLILVWTFGVIWIILK